MELEMKTEGKKLEFYTGRWVSFLPFIIFLGMIIVSVVLDAVSERSMWICCIVGLMIAFFLAKDKIRYGDAIAEGIAQKLTSVPVLCWIFAGIFTTTLRAAGLVQGIVWAAYNVGAHGMLFVLVAFISCAAFATAAGTGLGTTIAGISILYPAGCLLGANPLVLAGAIIGGGAFGDNLAPVSDTTICSALTQGADITGVVKSRLRYSAVAAAITILFILFFGGGGSVTGEALPHDLIAEYMNPKGLLMLIPAILTIYLAIKKGDVIYACIAGTAAVIVVALPTGLLTLSDIICLSEGGVSGTLVDGIGGMADIVILCLLVMGMVGVMKAGEGDKLLIDIATKVIRGVCGAELSIVILSAILGRYDRYQHSRHSGHRCSLCQTHGREIPHPSLSPCQSAGCLLLLSGIHSALDLHRAGNRHLLRSGQRPVRRRGTRHRRGRDLLLSRLRLGTTGHYAVRLHHRLGSPFCWSQR